MPKPRYDPWQMSASYSVEELQAMSANVENFLKMLWNTDVEEKNGVGSFTVYLTADQLGKIIGEMQTLRVLAMEWFSSGLTEGP